MPKNKKPEETTQDQVDQLHSIKVLHDTDGGKVLVSLLMTDVINNVYSLANGDGTDRDRLCAELKANLNLAKLILNAEENEEILKETLEEALRE